MGGVTDFPSLDGITGTMVNANLIFAAAFR